MVTAKYSIPTTSKLVNHTLWFQPVFENIAHIPPVVFEEWASFRLTVTGVEPVRLRVTQGTAEMNAVDSPDVPQYFFSRNRNVAITVADEE